MSIPYKYSMDEGAGLNESKEVKGILSFADNELLFEYKVYDTYGNGISNLSKFAIQLDNIKSIQYKKRFLFRRGKLIINANQAAFFEPLPGSDQGEVRLNIERRDRSEAIRIATKLNLYLSQQREEEKDE